MSFRHAPPVTTTTSSANPVEREPNGMPRMQRLDWQLLGLMLASSEHRPWAITELIALFGDEDAVRESLRRLRYAELIQRMSVYIMPSCAAVAYHDLADRYGTLP
jgi:hypothetical protein